jgi:hypothetical protein
MGKLAAKITGGLCLVAGLATLWLPIPTGLALIMIGLSLLIMTSPHVAVWLRALRRRYADLDIRLTRSEPFLPERLRRALAKTRARA